jgi:hypothetical protein
MGQRMVVLDSTYTAYSNNTAVLHVSQLPPNPAILAPGPAFLFVVVRGVPSVGVEVMVGSGAIEPQTVLVADLLPVSSMIGSDGAVTVLSGGGAQRVKSGACSFGRDLGLQAEWLLVVFALLATWAIHI